MSLFPHYLKVAARNMRRYPLQTVISVVGLAAGFVCLSLSALWLQYENTYNGSLPDADRLAMTKHKDFNGYYVTSSPLAESMLTMPEVEAYTLVNVFGEEIWNAEKGTRQSVKMLYTDTCCQQVLRLKIVQGDEHAFDYPSEDLIISSSVARSQFGDEDPIGKTLAMPRFSGKVLAVYADMDPHTDFYAEVINVSKKQEFERGVYSYSPLLIRLKPGKEVFESFARKVAAFRDHEDDEESCSHTAVRLMSRDYAPKRENTLSRSHQRAFFLISILLVVCALTNYITFYINRLRGRRREMALRLVHGETGRGLVALFGTEVLMVMLLAIAIGLLTVWMVRDVFASYANIKADGYILSGALLFMAVGVVLCLAVSLLAIVIAKHRSATTNIASSRSHSHLFMRASTAVQLAIGLCFVFCAVVMLRQLNLLRNHDWGVGYKNVAMFTIDNNRAWVDGKEIDVPRNIITDNGLAEKLRAIPGVEELMDGSDNFINTSNITSSGVGLRSNPEDEFTMFMYRLGINDPGNPVYQFTVVEGTLPRSADWQTDQIILTEAVRDKLGLPAGETVGKTIEEQGWRKRQLTVVAVIKDITWGRVHTGDKSWAMTRDYVIFKDRSEPKLSPTLCFIYDPHQRKALEERVKAMMEPYPDVFWTLSFGENLFRKQTSSEQLLSRLLTFVTVVAVLIALFGMYSIITLACRQRRKEIAIRKVHGAERRDVILLFVREYGLILLLAAVAAFAAGFLIMHRWLEQYLHPAGIPWWLYIVLLAAAALLIALCVGSRILRTARENPADVVKSE